MTERQEGMQMERDAVISECQKYRYLLRRTWDHEKPRALFIMLNPSTADASIDDPTIKSCVRLVTAIGYGSFEVVNLFAFRATKPEDMAKAPDPIGPDNDGAIEAALARCDMPICAWGNHKLAYNRSKAVFGAIRSARPAAMCFGRTKDGAPKHPLYIKSGTALEVYRQ